LSLTRPPEGRRVNEGDVPHAFAAPALFPTRVTDEFARFEGKALLAVTVSKKGTQAIADRMTELMQV
jgi:hypothetical protein